MKYTKVTLVNKDQHLSKRERDEILAYANTVICGAIVQDPDKSFLMQMRHIEGNVYEVIKCFWQYLPIGAKYLTQRYSVMIKLK